MSSNVLNTVKQLYAEIDVSDLMPEFCWVQSLIPMGKDHAIAFVYESKYVYWLLEIRGSTVEAISMPACVIKELEKVSGNFSGKLCACRVHDAFGILVCDRTLFLFSDLKKAPQKITIENPFVSPDGDTNRPCVAVSCGQSKDARVPVVLRHYNDLNSHPYFSLLSIDQPNGKAHWEHRLQSNTPLLLNIEGNPGAQIGDAYWTGEAYTIFSIGYSSTYNRYGMDFSALFEVDVNGQAVNKLIDIEENCFGAITASMKYMLVTPLYESGERKGKQTVFALDEGMEYDVKLPRGFAKYKIHEISEEQIWMSNNVRWPHRGKLCFMAGSFA